MATRGHRLAAALTLLAALLFAGRWTSQFLADQWWAATVSPAVGLLLTRRALLGLALDAAGILLATGWYLVQVRLAWRAIMELGPRERGGNPVVRRALQRPEARQVGLGAAVVLGLLIGSGLSAWSDTLMLAWTGVHYGITEPAFGLDAGVFVARLPLWLRVQAFATVLVLTALSLVALLLILTGAVRIGRGRLAITDQARRHLGLLLVLLALVIGASKVLEPYQLAAGIPVTLTIGVVRLHRSVSMVLVGMSLAVAALSYAWARRPLHSLLAGAWFALSAALVASNYLLPTDQPDPRDTEHAALRRRAEAVSYGLDPVRGAPESGGDWRFSLWDPGVLSRAVGADSVTALPTPSIWGDDPDMRPAWGIVSTGEDRIPRLVVVADDSVTALSQAVSLGYPPATPDTDLWRNPGLSPQALWPGASPVVVGPDGGVPLGGFFRRVALAWALQDGRLLAARRDERAGWYLDPAARLDHAVPFAAWRDPYAWIDGGRLFWVVNGYLTAEAFPGSRRAAWMGRPTALVRAGFVGVVEASTGATRIFLRPGADSLAQAWARSADDVIRPSTEIPSALRPKLAYPEAILVLQASLLAEGFTRGGVERPVPGRAGPGGRPGTYAVPLLDAGNLRLQALIVGRSRNGMDELAVVEPDSLGAPEAPDVLARRWQRFPLIQDIGDSVSAAGGLLRSGQVRYVSTGQGLLAYQPFWTLSPEGRVTVAAVAAARGDRLAVSRAAADALRGLATGTITRASLEGEETTLDLARRLVAEADSALREGDVAGFGRLFAQLRAVLEGRPEALQEPK
jgi:hypothetical protein